MIKMKHTKMINTIEAYYVKMQHIVKFVIHFNTPVICVDVKNEFKNKSLQENDSDEIKLL